MGGGLTTMAEEEDGGGMLESSWISSDRLVRVFATRFKSWFLGILG